MRVTLVEKGESKFDKKHSIFADNVCVDFDATTVKTCWFEGITYCSAVVYCSLLIVGYPSTYLVKTCWFERDNLLYHSSLLQSTTITLSLLTNKTKRVVVEAHRLTVFPPPSVKTIVRCRSRQNTAYGRNAYHN